MIPLVAPHVTYKDREYVKGRIDEGLLTDDSEVRTLEEAFAARFGFADAVATNSGTNALIVALETMNPGQLVRMPSYCCRAVHDAVKAAGHTPLLGDNHCDVEAAEYHLIADDAARVVVLPHMFGRAPGVRHPGAVVEDLTLSLGATANLDNLSVCSLHADKMVSAGRGGIVLLPQRCAGLAAEIRARASYHGHADDLVPAHSFEMSSTQAALAVAQLKRLDDMIDARQETAAYYTLRFRREGFPCPDVDGDNVFFRYLVGVDDPGGAIVRLRDHGVEAGRGVFPPLHRLVANHYYQGADQCARRLLSLPVHPRVTRTERERVVDGVLAVCQPG